MLTSSNAVTAGVLMFLCIIITFLLKYLLNKKNKRQLDRIFIIIFGIFIFWIISLILQITLANRLNINPIYFEYLVYIGGCFTPVAFFFMALIFSRTKITFKKRYLLLFVIPIVSLIVLWTNGWHHLFYEKYSVNVEETVFGRYFNIHYIYTLGLLIISLIILMKYTIKNSGFFSKQAILILIGELVPIVTNLLGSMGVIPMSTYTTPISLAVTIICFSLAMFKFNLLKSTPIALQTIVDRISDSYAILDDDYEITDYNETFIKTFKVKDVSTLRGKHFATFLKEIGVKNKISEFAKHFDKIDNSQKVERFELDIPSINRTLNTEITSIVAHGQFLGILVLFKDITQHKKDMKSLKDNQDLLVEQERLASLGQMIGGIAHNLKTPIFSVSGGLEGLGDLVKEYDESIDDPNVNSQDMHDIAKDMNEWISKLKEHVSYMSDVITTVKGQAVNMSENQQILFPISELFQHVNILMQHELKEKLANLEVKNDVPDTVKINGNITSLVQVINNLISNSIEAYGENPDKKIILLAESKNKDVIISVKDYGPGIPEETQKKLFKEMTTTKGKNGTGLGLFMSYSNIKAHFNGTMEFETSPNGTTFKIIIPIK